MRLKLLLFTLVLGMFGCVNYLSAQNKPAIPQRLYYCYTFREKFYLISQDSTFETSDAIHWKGYPNKISCKHAVISYVETDSLCYLFFGGGGNVYSFDGKNYEALYEEGDFKNQYGGSSYIYQNKLHLFGGYGMFTDKNITTYFNFKTRRWDKVSYKDPYYQLPVPRNGAALQLNKNEVLIGLGVCKFNESSTHWGQKKLNDFWKFDLQSKRWTKLGEMLEPSNIYSAALPYKGMILSFEKNKILGIDIINNRLIKFPNHVPFTIFRNFIYYNPTSNKFMVFKGQGDVFESIQLYSAEEFLGTKQIVSQLYHKPQSKWVSIGIFVGLVFLVGISVYSIYLNQPKIEIYSQIQAKIDEIALILNEEEYHLFNQIYQQYPHKMQYQALIQNFNQTLSPETQKKKLKISLDEIEKKLQAFLGNKKSIFEYTKNQNDKRMKEVKIR